MSPTIVNGQKQAQNIDGASFESEFPIGAPVQLELKGRKYATILRGARSMKYLLVDVPIVNNKPAVLDYNTEFIVRFFLCGSAYGFSTYITQVFGKHGLLVLEYPFSVKKYSLRESERIKSLIPMKVNIQGHKGVIPGAVLDLSDRGALIAVNAMEGVEAGGKIKIAWMLPNNTPFKSIRADIVNVKPSANKLLMGIIFDEGDKDSMKRVNEFYDQCATYFSGDRESAQNLKEDTLGVGLQVTMEYNKKKIISNLRGWKLGKGGYILIDPPSLGQLPTMLNPKVDMVVRLVKCGILYGLEANFSAVLGKANLWALSIKEDVLKFPLRSDERIYCLIPAAAYRKKEEKFKEIGKGMIANISEGGFRLLTQKSLEEDELFWITFSCSDLGMISNEKVKIMRSGKNNDLFEYSGSFVNMSRTNEQILKKFTKFCQNWLEEG